MDIGRVEDGLTIQILSLFCSLPLNLPLPTFAPRKAARRRCRWSASGRAWVLVKASVTSSVFFVSLAASVSSMRACHCCRRQMNTTPTAVLDSTDRIRSRGLRHSQTA